LIKFLQTYNKYEKIKIPKGKKDVINNLMKRDDIVLLKQDKGKGIVILDKTKYTEKCLKCLTQTDSKKSREILLDRLSRNFKVY